MKIITKPFILVLIGGFLISQLLSGFLFSQTKKEQDTIIEEVSVNWWQVPFFAVDNDGNPVTDLESGDIKLRLNGGIMPNFTLNKRTFSVTSRETEILHVPKLKQHLTEKPKVIVLLFDQALSGVSSTLRAKRLAEKIIMDAAKDTRFYVLTIDAFAGLTYVGEGNSANKEQLIQLIHEKIKKRKNERFVKISDFVVQMGGKRADKYQGNEVGFFSEIAAVWYKRKSMGFFYAFDTLYMFLNALEENKFLYFFSEGLSNSIKNSGRSSTAAKGMYNYYLRRVSNRLGRSGAVIFIINTMGVDQYNSSIAENKYSGNVKNSFSALSGEESLHLLSKESGGTYIEGAEQQIIEKLEKMNHAYYEISFPDPPQIKGTIRDIDIISLRKNIKIHSLKYLEKPKLYSQMNTIEKELLALNLVTQPQIGFIRNILTAYNAHLDKTTIEKSRILYSVTLPPSQHSNEIELYKLYLSTDQQGNTLVQKIEKEILHSVKSPLNIAFDLSQFKSKKEKLKTNEAQETNSISNEIKTYFVLVNNSIKPTQAYVYGMELYEDDPEIVQLIKKDSALKKYKGQIISDEEMSGVLEGAADYCEGLKKSAFHFYCREKILETRVPLTNAQGGLTDITKMSNKINKRSRNRNAGSIACTQVKGYMFGYRLIKMADNIKEERDFISSKDEIPVNREQVIKTTAFFSEKSIFAPVTLLDRIRQELYNFQFVRFTHYGDRRAIVIRAIPKNTVECTSIFGDIWIDAVDFSVLKIEADPRSVNGYDLIEGIAKKLRTRLYLSLEIEFNYLHEGIRFPTQVNMLEKYKGGRIIQENQGVKGWDRTRVQFSYSDYQFFNVNTDVEIH